jgi:hypothetical protein
MEEVTLKTSITGNKILLYFPLELRTILPYTKGELIRIIFKKDNNQSYLITKFNPTITIKKSIVNELKLKGDNKIILKTEKFRQIKKPNSPIYENKIDLLFFLPEITKKGSEIYSEEVIINGESFVRAVSIHSRGSSNQILLRRFIEPNLFGKLLGQIQAEGTKTNYDVVEFCNKNLFELRDFIYFLSKIGIPKDKLSVKLDYNIYFKDKLPEILNEFKDFLGLNVNYLSSSDRKAKGYGFKIIVRNTLLSEFILNSLKIMKKYLEDLDWDNNLISFSEGYLSKVLCGDGSFELTSKKRRKIQSRLTIADGSLDHLEHYKIILEKFGFHPHIYSKFQFIRTLCNLEQAKNLLRISAFENNPNQKKIFFFIKNNEVISS